MPFLRSAVTDLRTRPPLDLQRRIDHRQEPPAVVVPAVPVEAAPRQLKKSPIQPCSWASSEAIIAAVRNRIAVIEIDAVQRELPPDDDNRLVAAAYGIERRQIDRVRIRDTALRGAVLSPGGWAGPTAGPARPPGRSRPPAGCRPLPRRTATRQEGTNRKSECSWDLPEDRTAGFRQDISQPAVPRGGARRQKKRESTPK